MKKRRSIEVDESHIERRIATGKLKPVHIPRLITAGDILKYQICTEIIRFKKKSNLTQSALADMIGINKSEVSKLFSYQLDAFSSDRLLQMVRALQANGAEISYETIFDDVRRKVGVIDRKPKVR